MKATETYKGFTIETFSRSHISYVYDANNCLRAYDNSTDKAKKRIDTNDLKEPITLKLTNQ